MSKKIQVYRASGMPVHEQNIDLFAAAHGAFYDKVVAKYMPDKSKFPSQETAERMQKAMKRYEKRLFRKYPNTDKWEFIRGPRAMKKKIAEIGFPIAYALNAQTNELAYVILDVEF